MPPILPPIHHPSLGFCKVVLRLINEELTYTEVGERLGKTESNVKYFARALFRRFGVGDRRELVLKARHTGMVAPPEDAPAGGEADTDGG